MGIILIFGLILKPCFPSVQDQAVQDASTPSTTLRMRGVENDKGGGKEDGRIPVCMPQTNPRNSVATESEQREDRGYYRNK